MKAVRHFDRLQGGFIGTCTSNSPYSGTTYELCIVSSLISPRGTDVQLVTSVAAAKCRDCCAEVSFSGKTSRDVNDKRGEKEKGCTGGWRRHSWSYWARKSIFHSCPSSRANTAAFAGVTVADSQLSN